MKYPLGSDNLGRDVLSRMLYGSRVSLMVGFAAVLVAELAGIILGLISGYYGGRVDNVIMRVADIFMAYPFMLLTISVIAVLGNSIFNLILVLGLSDWQPITNGRTLKVSRRKRPPGTMSKPGAHWLRSVTSISTKGAWSFCRAGRSISRTRTSRPTRPNTSPR